VFLLSFLFHDRSTANLKPCATNRIQAPAISGQPSICSFTYSVYHNAWQTVDPFAGGVGSPFLEADRISNSTQKFYDVRSSVCLDKE